MSRRSNLIDILYTCNFIDAMKKIRLLKNSDITERDVWEEYDSELIQSIIKEIEDGEVFSSIEKGSS